MIQIPKKQVLERWGILSENLREALVSPVNGEFIWQLGAKNHLSEDKISIIAILAGDVIFGFIEAEDLSSQIQVNLGLDPRIAQTISNEINKRIFSPLREEINKAYDPIIGAAEIKPRAKTEAEIKTAGMPKKNEAITVSPLGNKPESMSPKPMEITGLPLVSSAEPLKPAEFPKAAELPKTEVQPIVPAVFIPTEKSFDKTQDRPFIIHQETEARPVAEKKTASLPSIGWFKKSLSAQAGLPSGRQEGPKKSEAPVKVELETYGQAGEPFNTAQDKERKEPVIAKTEAPKQRIVHYREMPASTPFGKPSEITQAKPFNAAQTKPVDFFQGGQKQPLKEIPSVKIPMPVVKTEPEPPKPMPIKPEPIAKPIEPGIIDLNSFGGINENETKNEVQLEGNIINLKNNKPKE